MTDRFAKRSLFAASEGVAANYGVDPSSTGVGYTYIPAWKVGELKDLKAQEPTDQQDGTPHGQTPPEEGADGWEFSMNVPLIGLSTAAGDGQAVTADDWFDLLAGHIFADSIDENGEGLAAGSTTSSIVLDAVLGGLQSLMPIHDVGVPTGAERTQWGMITSIGTAPTYPIAPTLSQAPTAAAVRYGTKTYLPSDNGGNSLAFVHREDQHVYTLLGGRCVSAKIPRTAAKKNLTLDLVFRGNEKIEAASTKTNLPTITRNTVACLKALRSPIWFNNVAIPSSTIEVDFGIGAEENESTAANNGRSNYESMSMKPTVMISPIFNNTLQELKRNVTTGPMLLQLGAGIYNAGLTRLNAQAIHFALAHVEGCDPKNDKGYIRTDMKFVADKMGVFSGTTAARIMQWVRA